MKTLATFTKALANAITEAMLEMQTLQATDIPTALHCNGAGGGGIYLLGSLAGSRNDSEYTIAFVADSADNSEHRTKEDVQEFCHLLVELPVRMDKIVELRQIAMTTGATADQVAHIFARRNAAHAAYLISDAVSSVRWNEPALCKALQSILAEAGTPELPGLN